MKKPFQNMKFSISFHFSLICRSPYNLNQCKLAFENIRGDDCLLAWYLGHYNGPLVNFETIVNLNILNFYIQNCIRLARLIPHVYCASIGAC